MCALYSDVFCVDGYSLVTIAPRVVSLKQSRCFRLYTGWL